MKTIQEVESMLVEYISVGDPDAEWKSETVGIFPGTLIKFDKEWDHEYAFAFRVCLTFSGISAYAIYYLGGGSLRETLRSLAAQLCEEIEEGGAKRVREQFKSILRI